MNTASPYDPELLSTCPELNTGSRCLDTHVDRAALFTKAKCPWRNKWISKGWPIQTTKYYSAFNKEVLRHAASWMDPKDITPSEISQSQKDKYNVIPLI